MMRHMGDRIRHARETAGFSQLIFAGKLKVTSRTIQRWEKGEQFPDADKVVTIAHLTRTNPQWVLSGEGMMFGKSEEHATPPEILTLEKIGLVKVPLLSSVPGGQPALIFHPDFVDRYVVIDDVRDPGAIGLLVRGQSMSPKLEEGDIIIVSPKKETKNGDICVIRVGEEDTVKKIRFDGNFVHLIPLNRDFEPMVVKKKDVTFVWKVVRVIKEL